ncbi:Negative elongation factor A [Halotydeus destructor]|nr:Negative elongation factor A [Halotydeus destructor]
MRSPSGCLQTFRDSSSKMAARSDSGSNLNISDTSLWLHNKLGTSNDLWSGSSICSQLTSDVLRNIRDCYHNLQSQVKLKLLLAFLHIPRRNIEEWRMELEEIQEIALEDSDQWVSMVAELLKKYPIDGTINFNIQENATVFTDLVSELKKLVKKHVDKNILPLECLFLNKNAFSSQLGQDALKASQKHFTLKRKPKSAALRAELLQRSTDAATSVRRNSTSSSVPIRCRGVSKNFDAPLRPIPRLNQPFKAPNENRNRNNISRPVTVSKRDVGIKLLDITEQPIGRDAKRKKKNDDDKDKSKEDKLSTEPEQTPDYAAGLSMIPPSPAPAYSLPTTSHDPMTLNKGSENSLVPPSEPEEIQKPAEVQPTEIVQQDVVQQQVPSQQPQFVLQQPTQQLVITQQPQPPTERKTLSLSREQMVEAQEMFRNSNKVSRPEKALILGFMAGSRDNPCPHLGNVVTIKLSENMEPVAKADGTVENMSVETLYQMNYSTGEGKKIKKYTRTENSLANSQSVLSTPSQMV